MKRYRALIWIALAVLPLIVFWQVQEFDFVGYDDQGYVYGNARVLAGLDADGVRWAFTTLDEANWHPLVWLSLMLDVELHGGTPGGFHRTNSLLHVANGLLLFALLAAMSGERGKSAFVAALFAIHPLHVESVAWISSRKDVLSTLFGLLALLAYARYVRSRGVRWYAAALAAYACSLLSKQMLVTLPFLLLLLDYWPLGRLEPRAPGTIRRLVLEKLPFLTLAAAFSVIVYYAQQHGEAVRSAEALPLVARFLNAPVAYVLYLAKTVWPAGLAAFYPHPGAAVSIAEAVGAALLLVGVSIVAWWQVSRSPFLFVGWFWFLGMLVPVLGLVQVGGQQRADRYTYLPIVGLFVIVAWFAPRLFPQTPWRNRLLSGVAATVVVLLAFTARAQTATWRNTETLFEHALAVTPNNAIAHLNLGSYLGQTGRHEEALEHVERAVAIAPDNAAARNNLGLALSMTGRPDEALPHFEKALQLDPRIVSAYMNRGHALVRIGRAEESLASFRSALELEPENVEIRNTLGAAYRDLGRSLAQSGEIAEAISRFREALRLQPEDAVSHYDLASGLYLQGSLDESRLHYEAALGYDPGLAEAHNGLGLVLLRKGDRDAAAERFRRALEIRPDFAPARRNLEQAPEP